VTFVPKSSADAPHGLRAAYGCMMAAAGIPISLLCDFSWESTVGIDRFWGLPHVMTYLAVASLVGLALWMIFSRRFSKNEAVNLASFRAPLGVWLVLWSGLAFVTALGFDRWWQSAYGMGAGIWHPPQLLKATAFFAAVIGVWLLVAMMRNHATSKTGKPFALLFSFGGGLVLALIFIVGLPSHYPNQQHSASFYRLACATYPFVLAILGTARQMRWPATTAALFYTAFVCAHVWLLPLFAAKPLTGPIYNPMEHLMPPPFPLLLIIPALAMDWLAQKFSQQNLWLRALLLSAAFFFLFLGVQWVFSEFLLMNLADNWFFAGGGKHWPFFLKINPTGRINFWESPADTMTLRNAVIAFGLTLLTTRLGLSVGAWMARVQR
jgi:hypothetical protein